MRLCCSGVAARSVYHLSVGSRLSSFAAVRSVGVAMGSSAANPDSPLIISVKSGEVSWDCMGVTLLVNSQVCLSGVFRLRRVVASPLLFMMFPLVS